MLILNLQFFLFTYIFTLINAKGILDYSYDINTTLFITVGKLTSIKGVLPYSYSKLQICNNGRYPKADDSLGEILTGEETFITNYQIKLRKNNYCIPLCESEYNDEKKEFIQKLIKKNYTIQYHLDKLPAGLIDFNLITQKTKLYFNKGIPVGYLDNDEYYIYNHLQFHILVNKVNNYKERYNIVGFSVLPFSIKQREHNLKCAYSGRETTANFEKEKQKLDDGTIMFTYDIVFEDSNISMASRWDNYRPGNSKIHWASIILSYTLVIILTFMIGYLLRKTVKSEIDSFTDIANRFKIIQEFDWRQISGDVFRTPSKNPVFLSALIGTGIQLFLMCSIMLILGVFGFLNPEKRVNMINIGILLFCVFGLVSGYVSSKFYKLFGGTNFITNSLATSILFPGFILIGYIVINFILLYEKSTAAVNAFDILSLFILWIFCTFPLVLIGSFFGIKTKAIEIPCQVNMVPSFIPEKPWYLHTKYTGFIIGLLGFLTIFIELEYVMASLWKQQIYFTVTFLWLSFIIFIIYSSELAIIFVYLNLCKRDYLWWWRSFFVGSSPIIYFMLYSVYYYYKLKVVSISSTVVYFGVMILISSIISIITGTISTLFSFTFIKEIYFNVQCEFE